MPLSCKINEILFVAFRALFTGLTGAAKYMKGIGEQMKAFLILEDGTVFTGKSIGSKREMISEIVFNTSMTGYLEVLTDLLTRDRPS